MFRDTLSLPMGIGNSGEGESDSHPIIVPGISSEIFAFIMNTLFGRYVQHRYIYNRTTDSIYSRYDVNPALPHLLAGLDFSLAWVIPNLREYAIDHISRLKTRLHPAMLLSYGRHHGVIEWINPTVKHLIDRPFSTYDSEVINTISSDTLIVIARLREKLEQLRVHLSLRGPTVFHAKECKDNTYCNNVWDNVWLTSVGRKLLHPDEIFRPTFSEVKSFAENLKAPGMTPACFEAVSRSVREGDSWDFETKAVEKAVELLIVPRIDLTLPLMSEGMEMIVDS